GELLGGAVELRVELAQSHQPVVLLLGLEVPPLNILNQGNDYGLLVRRLPHDGWNSLQPGSLRGLEPPRTDDKLVAVSDGPDEDRLENSLLLNRAREVDNVARPPPHVQLADEDPRGLDLEGLPGSFPFEAKPSLPNLPPRTAR